MHFFVDIGEKNLGYSFNKCLDVQICCRPITDTQGLKDYLNSIYTVAAQYDNPPLYFVKNMCDAIDNAVSKGTLLRIKAGIVAANQDSNCVDTEITQSSGIEGWDFQVMYITFSIYPDKVSWH